MVREAEKSAYEARGVASPGLINTKIVQVQPMTQPVGGIMFYRPRYGSTEGVVKPAGSGPRFKVKTIAALQRIHDASEYALSGYSPQKETPVAAFGGENFEIIDGLDYVQTGRHEVEGLSCNEAYEEFLLGLSWGPPLGVWLSPLHVLAICADGEVEEIVEDQA